MPAVTVAGAGAAVGALAAALALVGAAAGDAALAPLAAGAAAGLLGALLGALVEAPPHAASSRPAASANAAGQRPLDQLALITGTPSLLLRRDGLLGVGVSQHPANHIC